MIKNDGKQKAGLLCVQWSLNSALNTNSTHSRNVEDEERWSRRRTKSMEYIICELCGREGKEHVGTCVIESVQMNH